MGIYKDITIHCDACNDEGYESCTVKEARKNAKADGWRRIKEGDEYKDFCPNCVDLLKG